MTLRSVVSAGRLLAGFVFAVELCVPAGAWRPPPAVTRGPKIMPRPAEIVAANAPGTDRLLPPLDTPCLCGKPFVLDGNIDEFVHYDGDSQSYFITDWFDPHFGRLLPGAWLCPRAFMAVDAIPGLDQLDAAGPTGFGDSPMGNGMWFAPTGFNIGRVFVAYSPEQDPDGDPANGTGVYFIALDVSAPAELDLFHATAPVAFDVDGDGSRESQTEIAPDSIGEAPLDGGDVYVVELDTNNGGYPEITIKIAEAVDRFPRDAIFIDPLSRPQRIDGYEVRRLVRFVDWSGQLPGTAQEQAVRFLDAYPDGRIDWRDFGIDADIEFAIMNVSALPGNDDPRAITLTVWADAVEDMYWSAGVDRIVFKAAFPPVEDLRPCGDIGALKR
jgi:hypothetical protein